MATANELLSKITEAGNAVREAKAAGTPKQDLKPLIDVLLAAKAEYKEVTGEDPPQPGKGSSKKDKKKAAAAPAAPPAAAAPPAGPAEDLLEKITAAGDSVRSAKQAGMSKAELKPLIDALLAAKAEYKEVTGEDPPQPGKGSSKKDKKKAAAAPPAPPAAAAPLAGSAGDLLEKIAAAGDSVRVAKQSGTPKAELKPLIDALLAAKAEYKELTGEDPPQPGKGSSKKDKKKAAAAPAAAAPGTSKNAAKKAEKERLKAEKKAANAAKQAAQAIKAETASTVSTGLYGVKPLIRSSERTGQKFHNLAEINGSLDGTEVLVRCRIHSKRATGSKMCFLVFRQRTATLQGLIVVGEKVDKAMVKFCDGLNLESVVDVRGKVTLAPSPITGCSQSDVEIQISGLFLVSAAPAQLPLQIDDAARSEAAQEKLGLSGVSQDTRLNNRWLDLRSTTSQGVFRVQAAVCMYFREFLISQGFQEIHTPKIIPAASEGGANVFKLGYFGGDSFLAQSPQLYKQMALNCDFDRVFEIGPVFRAEDSNTHRHLTEFTGLDLEMTFKEHYHEVLDVLEQLFVHIFKSLQDNFAKDIAVVAEQFHAEPFEFLEPSLRLAWPDAIAMLREAGEEIGDFEDLSTPMEKRLGALVKAKYHTDFYILDKFPLCIRPFYTMPSPENEAYSNSYDLMMRGEEIMSGAQRIHDYDLLLERANVHEIPINTISDYLESFKYGSFPHGGGGVGMERVVMLFLGLNNIRKTSMFPRDPKRCTP